MFPYWFDIADQSLCIKINKLLFKISVIPVSTHNSENTDKKIILIAKNVMILKTQKKVFYCEKCNSLL